jgi:hypothetical protein
LDGVGRLPVERCEVWAAHVCVARALLPVHRGREIDQTEGFLLLFGDAQDAVAYAVAYRRAIGAQSPPLKARAGPLVGPVILTENATADVARGAEPLEVDGLAKPVAAMGTDEAIDALDTHGGPERRVAMARELDDLISACRRAMAPHDGGTAASTQRAAGARP